MENLSTLNNFFDGRDESWYSILWCSIYVFVVMHMCMVYVLSCCDIFVVYHYMSHIYIIIQLLFSAPYPYFLTPTFLPLSTTCTPTPYPQVLSDHSGDRGQRGGCSDPAVIGYRRCTEATRRGGGTSRYVPYPYLIYTPYTWNMCI